MEFKIVDALQAPRRGRILRLRTVEGTPTVDALEGATMEAIGPRGDEERRVRIIGFPTIGGRPDDERYARTGRVDVVVVPVDHDALDDILFGWTLRGPA